ncbi:MAG TPA: histidine phosphatase family protein [Hyphomicrobiaceae bacterium]|nr:histidine phosphatase family protein [Hyphomicrobiaceae bacterium]
MSTIFFITHPEVVVEPTRPIARWHLSDMGIARMRAFAASSAMSEIRSIWASTETKAIESAGILAGAHGLPISIHPGLDENDRSATGYLPPEEFQRTADAFFANPHESVRGWERAIDAQRRVATAFEAIVTGSSPGDIAIVAHGGVGTLLYCHLAKLAISRQHDQPAQGCYWSCARDRRVSHHAWRSIGSA